MNKTQHVPFLITITALSILVLSAAVPARAATCVACHAAQQHCSANCFDLEDKAESVACLIACDNAAATCTLCDKEATLRSEDLVAQATWLSTLMAACHSTTACGPDYTACSSYSTSSPCGEPYCGKYIWCEAEGCTHPSGACHGNAMRQNNERYRICFNAQGQSCTEYQRSVTILSCGC